VEVSLIARPRVSTLKVGRELMAQLFLGGKRSLGEVHELRPGHAGQGHREVAGHDVLIPTCGEDEGGVDLQEFGRVD
jgi:hypothetical protein